MSHVLVRVLLLSAVVVAALPASGSAQTPTRLGVVTTLAGDATVARAGGAPRALAFKDEVFAGDTIRTAAGGLVRVLMRGSTLVAIGETSAVGLAADAARSTVRLDGGTVSVVVGGDRPAPLDIRTPHATASLRGTSVIAQTGAAPAGGVTFYVLRGAIEVKAAGAAGATVKALESATVTGGKIGPVVPLSKERAAGLLKDFRLVPAHPDAPAEAVKALGERGATEAEREAKVLRDQGVRGLPKTEDPNRRPVVPIQPNIAPTTAPKGCC
jgi:ferric-dicitrate binding protein FerR (iron transport regulator)